VTWQDADLRLYFAQPARSRVAANAQPRTPLAAMQARDMPVAKTARLLRPWEARDERKDDESVKCDGDKGMDSCGLASCW
jgi:hypothetical protein